jgi:hypothetical protein
MVEPEHNTGVIERVAPTRPIWKTYKEIHLDNYETPVNTQDRAVLDSAVDHEFATAVLREINRTLQVQILLATW